jgi:hypothetical protein
MHELIIKIDSSKRMSHVTATWLYKPTGRRRAYWLRSGDLGLLDYMMTQVPEDRAATDSWIVSCIDHTGSVMNT